MDVVLIILGVMGFGAIITSAYVFLVAARTYVSDGEAPFRRNGGNPPGRALIERSPTDRRKGKPVTFPLAVNGILIAQDRRALPDRRAA
jgi:hypothetical protein